MRASRAALAAFAAWSAACGGAPEAAVPAAKGPPPAASAGHGSPGEAPGTGPAAGPDGDDAEAAVARELVQTSRVRELPAKGPVKGTTLSRAEMSRRVRQSIEREVPPEVMRAQADLLVALGVADVGFDYMQAVIDLMGAELAGYYDPADKTMYLASDLGREMQKATLAHELVHALQDQYYDLGKLLDYAPDRGDFQSAGHALAEGDATSAMLDQMLADRGGHATDLPDELIGVQVRAAAALTASAPGVPDLLRRSLIAPYVDGILFVHDLRRRGGWATVDAAWRSPPESTEQILHPEKYASKDAPLRLPTLPAMEGGPAATPYTDILGEQSLRLLLEEWTPRKTAIAAAAGWGGDRVAVFREGSRVAVAIRVTYDDEASAARGGDALARAATAQGAKAGNVGAGVCAERPDRGPLLALRERRDLVLVGGPYEETVTGKAVAARSGGTCAGARAWARRVLAAK